MSLGHIISGEGIKVDPAKVEVVSNWKRPKSITEIKSFLGLMGYYQRFLHSSNTISSGTGLVRRASTIATQSLQKCYVNKRWRLLEFEVGDYVFLKISPVKGVVRFGKWSKLNPRYIGPHQITRRIGEVAYGVELPPKMFLVHNVFHVSMLRKCLADASQVILLQLDEFEEDLTFIEDVIQILDKKEQVLKNKVIPLVLMLWRHHNVEEATWE